MKPCQVSCFISLLSLLIGFGNGQTQVVIDREDLPMDFGTAKTYYVHADLEGIEIDPGAGGENRVWDFSQFAFEEIETDSILNPENIAGAEEYEHVNRVTRTDNNILGLNFGGSSFYLFEMVSDSGLYTLGQAPVPDEGNGFGMPFNFGENAIVNLPLPAEFELDWDSGLHYTYGMEAPDTLLGGVLDSLYIVFDLGGFSEIDAWGRLTYSGGEVPVLRQHLTVGGALRFIGTQVIFGRRIEVEIPFGLEIDATQIYRWIAPGIGEVARITSLVGEQEPDFQLAGSVRLLFLPPALAIENATLDFGEVNVGNARIAELALTNAGPGAAVISELEMAEELAIELEVLTDFPLALESEGEASIRFLWQPRVARDLDGQVIYLYHNDPQLDNPLEITLSGHTPVSVKRQPEILQEFSLAQNYPNPFNATTQITFQQASIQHVRLEVLDLNSHVLATLCDRVYAAGEHRISFEAGTLPAGIYTYRLITGERVQLHRLMIITK